MNFDIERYIHHGLLSIPDDKRLDIPERITIPEGVHTVSNMPVMFCRGVKRVFFPQSVHTIESLSFCKWDLTKIDIPHVKTVGNYAFAFNGKLNIVDIRGLRGKIGDSAFALAHVQKYVIPEGVTEIGVSAFWMNIALKSVTLPKSLVRIEERAFKDCTSLKSIQFPPNLEYIGDDAFAGSLYSLDSVVIPRKTVLGKNSFYSGIKIIRV